MHPKIIAIVQEEFYISKHYSFDGYIISLDDWTCFSIGISNFQQCCESWGYASSNDDLQSFIGSELFSVDVVDDKLHTSPDIEMYEGGVTYVNLNTSTGVLQFTLYNEHNGYYSHEVVVKKNSEILHSEDV